MNNVIDGLTSLLVVDIEATSQLSIAMVENSVSFVERISFMNISDAALAFLVTRGRAKHDGDKVILA